MKFGKNRVQYSDFYWEFYRYKKFDTYFNQFGRELAEFTADFALEEIPRLERFFNYNLDKRIIFVVFNKLSDFRQSNIGLITGQDEYNIGGVTTISRNKVFIYYEGSYKKFREQITAAIAKVLINEILYGFELKDNVTNSTLINLPEWYFEGLISFVSRGWDFEIENKVKDGIYSKRYKKFNRLIGEDAVYAGHSFWKFIADNYGESVIPSIIYLTRINKNSNSCFLYALGFSLKELSYEWNAYYQDLFKDYETLKSAPETGKILKRPRRKRVYQQVKVDLSGKYISYVTNEMGKYKIWLYNSETGKHKKILRREHKLEQITDYSYPVTTWHPSGRILTFITEEEGGIRLYYYTLATKTLEVRNLYYFEKILDFSFSDDGSLFVFSGVKNGKTDIFVHTIASGTYQQITDDYADDFNPRFINNSEQIIFSSNRSADTIGSEITNGKKNLYNDLFIFDYKNLNNELIRLTDKEYVNKIQPYEFGKNKFLVLKDESGIINRYISEFDSTISFIDTTIHYRYYSNSYPVSNYSRNIIEHNYNDKAGQLGEIIFNDGRYYMYNNEVVEKIIPEDKPEETEFRKTLSKKLAERDSTENISRKGISIQSIKDNTVITSEQDTFIFDEYEIDINNYIFEKEKINYYNSKLKEKNLILSLDTGKFQRPKIRIYQPAFYQNYMVNQVDFSFLNESYQAFTGGAVYFNPGMNMLFKIGTNDLFDNYKITGGLRLSPDFNSNEYLISVENLKKRLDKQLIFHRQTFKNEGQEEGTSFTVKTYTHELSLIFRYPFDQVRSWIRSITFRSDRTVFLATDVNYLNRKNIYKTWVGLKAEYIFDNTRSLGLNLPSGTRYKLFAELYQQVNDRFDDLVVLGADFRHYVRIHRNLIWANRFAASTSQGSSRLIYYLGGVDNWTNLTPFKVPTFIPLSEIPINTEANYVYQTVATNLRGFSQNIRNGNSFALINSEIRWPVFKYIANYPISNSFLENFQIVGFFDIGTAWSGITPWAKENAYDKQVIPEDGNGNPITIIIDTDREPIVAGYGFGFRSQLLGYFIRLDWAWGIEDNKILDRIFYFSLSLDF
ncbi:MAG: PD40 domain-containing protein [Bacteroidales bacterium]|nr:MAG: PD40 domain-containing protein [Bacteroidales bacterium]